MEKVCNNSEIETLLAKQYLGIETFQETLGKQGVSDYFIPDNITYLDAYFIRICYILIQQEYHRIILDIIKKPTYSLIIKL
jgi:hypothetical protein